MKPGMMDGWPIGIFEFFICGIGKAAHIFQIMIAPSFDHFFFPNRKIILHKFFYRLWHIVFIKKTRGMTCIPFRQLFFYFFSNITTEFVLEVHLGITGQFHTIRSMNDETGENFLQVFTYYIIKKKYIMIIP